MSDATSISSARPCHPGASPATSASRRPASRSVAISDVVLDGARTLDQPLRCHQRRAWPVVFNQGAAAPVARAPASLLNRAIDIHCPSTPIRVAVLSRSRPMTASSRLDPETGTLDALGA